MTLMNQTCWTNADRNPDGGHVTPDGQGWVVRREAEVVARILVQL